MDPVSSPRIVDPPTRRATPVALVLTFGALGALLCAQLTWIGNLAGWIPAVAITVVHLLCLVILWFGFKSSGVSGRDHSAENSVQNECCKLRDELAGANKRLLSELCDRKRVEETLSRTISLEKAVLAVSSHLVGAADLDIPVHEALSGLARVSNTSRIALYLISASDRVVEEVAVWPAPDHCLQTEIRQRIPLEEISWCCGRMNAGETLYVSDLSTLPDTARTELLRLEPDQGKSLVMLPFRFGERTGGFLTLCGTERVSNWAEEELSTLRLFAEILGAALGRKQLQDQLIQSQKMEAVGRLAGGMAHDFNNILTVIMAYSEFMLSGSASLTSGRNDIGEIRKAAERASSLIRQLLTFSRRQVTQPRVIDLNALVTSTEQMLRRLIGEDIEIATDLQDNVGRIKADPVQLEQAMLNLAVNARDAMNGGGRLTIRTADVENGARRTGAHVLLSVSDTGCGMSEEVQAHLFEPFFTTKKKGEGTGLGLSTVYGIVRQSEGHIVVTSRPGAGSSFDLYFPRVLAPAQGVEGEGQSQACARGGETVLVVEDEDLVRELIEHSLVRYNYRVITASCPDEAIRICSDHAGPIHLMVTDLVMPRMDGVQLAGAVRSARPEMKVLYMSGYIHNTRGIPAIPEPYFLQKPFTPETLAVRVRSLLDSAGQQAPVVPIEPGMQEPIAL